jgi:hypothetical protein
MTKYRDLASVDMLPKIPSAIKPLREVNGEPQMVSAMVIGGLNLIGKSGCICPTVTLLNAGEESGKMFGWSLCIGHPEQAEEVPYYFETSDEEGAEGTRGTELPTAMVYFQAEIGASLTSTDALIEQLDEVFAYVLPYISDKGPPPPHSSDEVFVQILSEQSDDWSSAQAEKLLGQANLLLDKFIEDFVEDGQDYWALFHELNKRLHESGMSHAWKGCTNDPDYNPSLGIIERAVGQKTVRVSIGLPSDGFAEAHVVVQLTPYDD